MSCKISGILVRHTSFLKRKIILTFPRWHVLCTVHYRQSMVQSMHKNSLFTSVSQCCTNSGEWSLCWSTIHWLWQQWVASSKQVFLSHQLFVFLNSLLFCWFVCIIHTDVCCTLLPFYYVLIIAAESDCSMQGPAEMDILHYCTYQSNRFNHALLISYFVLHFSIGLGKYLPWVPEVQWDALVWTTDRSCEKKLGISIKTWLEP